MHTNVSRRLRRGAATAAAVAIVGSGLFTSSANGDISWDISWSDSAWADRELSTPEKSDDRKSASSFEELFDLIELARTTAPFHDVQNALDAGWTVQPMCMDYPDGFHGEPPGTMGHHFYNVEYLTDEGRIDVSEPELLLYEKRANGTWRFNAVEYIIPAGDLPGTAPAPELFGQEFRFYPEIGSNGIWGLHVWLWRSNPYGLYANLNPNVTCEYADTDSHAH